MKKILFFLVFQLSFVMNAQVTTSPASFEANQPVTIYFNKTGTPLAGYTGTIYAHIGVTVNGVQWQNVKGAWNNNTTQPALTFVSGTTYKLDISPDLFTYFGVGTSNSITQICMVFRVATGAPQSVNYYVTVGVFQATLVTPSTNSTTILNSGQSMNIAASNTGGTASYELFSNNVSINTFSGSAYSFSDTNIVTNKNYELRVSMGTVTIPFKFAVMINPITQSIAMQNGLEDGINYNSSDPTKATLVLDAPGKDFVYVAGSFNSWSPDGNYAMKKDPTSGKFWLEINGLTSGQKYTYQYWVVDQTPIANSPILVKTADPYSTLVLSPFDDPWIPANSYPNLPPFPAGQEREVTVLQTAQTPYNWQVTNFTKPEKENLVVYEVLIRDFDANRNIQDLINRIDYFKNLKVNAIQLMPIMEFEGNESWGYNTCFHMALDKFYGTQNKIKEFIDLCHQNGIAVILDLALNHAFGRNPMVRMWMNDPDGDGWGDPASDSPYFNQIATHSYSVGSDFNHSQARTKYYVKRVVKQWIQEFHIDGFRWDLTKGFTQNCTGSDACTNGYQQDRVDVLKDYVDYSWSLDPTHYAIFEHLGIDSEEQQWANYRINETPSKGVMMWGKTTDQYNQLTMGFNSNNDISRILSSNKGFTAKREMGYAESHDEERLMYKNLIYGNSTNTNHNVKVLNTALYRISALGAVTLLVPGPKMIWHFAELGMNNSVFTCTDNTVNTSTDATSGDCKLYTKPQPQWTNNWLGIPERAQIYNDWSRMIDLKKNNPVFKGSCTISSGTTLQPRIYIWDDTLPISSLKNVVILSNFDVNTQNVFPNFPYTGTWVNLMDNTTISVTSTTSPISIEAGGFRVYGNQNALGISDNEFLEQLVVSPNPTSDYFALNRAVSKVEILTITGQLVKTFSNETSDFQYPISDLHSGLFILKIHDSTNREKTLKLIIN